MTDTLLAVKDLTITFSGQTVIDRMHFKIRRNTLTTFLGPSGSGKTTVLRAIAGLNRQISGTIVLDGKPIQELAVNQRDIGMVFQSYALFPNLSVFDNVAYGLRVRKVATAEIEAQVTAMLQTVDLSDKRDAYPDNLSGGQKQRVAIARAMVLKPKLLLLDEPLSALDAKIRVDLRNQIRQYQQRLGITMLFITHDQSEAMAISDDIIVMNDGAVQQQGSPLQIYAEPVNPFMARFIGNHNVLTGVQLQALGCITAQKQAQYIVRPEQLSPVPLVDKPSWSIAGKLTAKTVLGDRLLYRFETEAGVCLKVEVLNQATALPLDIPQTLYLAQDALLQVGAAHADS